MTSATDAGAAALVVAVGTESMTIGLVAALLARFARPSRRLVEG